MSVQLLPAVDVVQGRASQVAVGECDDPLRVARSWVQQGARWLHLVDLDRAFRRGENLRLLAHIIDSVPVPVQLSGGVDDRVGIMAAMATGARRVNLASSVLLDLELISWASGEYGPRVVVGVDVREGVVVARGSGVRVGPLDVVVPRLAGCGATQFIVADASRDGSRRGADIEMFGSVTSQIVAAVPGASVVASGGVGSVADVAALAALDGIGLWGVVLGAGLHQGTFTLPQALAAVTP